MNEHLSKHWVVAPPLPPSVDAALAEYPPFLRQVLYNRGITTKAQAQAFLENHQDLHDPWLLPDMEVAVDRLLWAIDHQHPIVIYGDYDVDGVTATVLLQEVITLLGGHSKVYIPSRFDEGYGLNIQAIDELADGGARLIVTVDCGIRSIPEAVHARERGVDLIITDHHHPRTDVPPAQAVVCPKRADSHYPDENLAGVGLAYKLAEALMQKRPPHIYSPEYWLDLVALGTVADVVPLVGENRVLVQRGLARIRRGTRVGLATLAQVAGLDLRFVSASGIGFVLAPRLNAAGRLNTAMEAHELLIEQDPLRALQIAQSLERWNRERQQLMLAMQVLAEERLGEYPDKKILTVFEDSFNEGVVGLVAARLAEKYYRPAVVGSRGEVYSKASCRSIGPFHITRALDRCADLLERHGGHALAAGFTVHNEKLPSLVERLEALAEEELTEEMLRPMLYADVEIPLSQLHPSMLPYLERLEPTGLGNPEVVFVSRGVEVRGSRVVGSDGKHLSLKLSDGRIVFDAIAFRQGHRFGEIPPYIDVMYTFEVNRYNGRESLQLRIRDFKPA